MSPFVDLAGINCGINQGGDVWFIGGSLQPHFTRNCTVPHGKAIFTVVVSSVQDYPCPAEFAWEPAPGQSLEAFLRSYAADGINGVLSADAYLDGKPLKVKRVATKLFGFIGAADHATNWDPCVTGAPQLAVVDGYFVTVDPPSRGSHVLQVRSTFPGGDSLGTINLKVE